VKQEARNAQNLTTFYLPQFYLAKFDVNCSKREKNTKAKRKLKVLQSKPGRSKEY